jgi:hypothetical protein
MSPSTWNFAGDELRTAFTAYVFHVNTAFGGIGGAGGGWFAVADPDASNAVTAAAATSTTRSATRRRATDSCKLFMFSSFVRYVVERRSRGTSLDHLSRVRSSR